MTSKYFKPYIDLLGPKNSDLTSTKKKKYKSDDSRYKQDNGKVMTGEAFKWLK